MPEPSNVSKLPMDRLATIGEVAAYLDLPVATLYAWRHKGTGPRAARIGKHLRYDCADVRAYVDQQKGAA